MSKRWGDQSTFTLLDYYRECGGLPAGWSINLIVYADEASISLESPDGDDVDVCTDDRTTGEIVREMVRVARAIHNGDDPNDEEALPCSS